MDLNQVLKLVPTFWSKDCLIFNQISALCKKNNFIVLLGTVNDIDLVERGYCT